MLPSGPLISGRDYFTDFPKYGQDEFEVLSQTYPEQKISKTSSSRRLCINSFILIKRKRKKEKMKQTNKQLINGEKETEPKKKEKQKKGKS